MLPKGYKIYARLVHYSFKPFIPPSEMFLFGLRGRQEKAASPKEIIRLAPEM